MVFHRQVFLILLIGFITINFFSYADCISCFSLSKVIIKTKSGAQLKGYIPIYTDISYDLQSDSVEVGDEIVGYIKQYHTEISFVDSITQVPIIGIIFLNEQITQIDTDSVTSIVLEEYTSFSGAGGLVGISKRDFKLLTTRKIVNYGWILGSVCDKLLVNTSTVLDSTDFRTFIDYHHTQERSIPYHLSKLLREHSSFQKHKALEEIKNNHYQYLAHQRAAIGKLSIESTDSVFLDYMNRIYTFELFKCEYHEVLYESLEDMEFESRIDSLSLTWNVSSAYEVTEDMIDISCSNELSPFEKYQRLMRQYGTWSIPRVQMLHEASQNIIDRYNIVSHTACFD